MEGLTATTEKVTSREHANANRGIHTIQRMTYAKRIAR